MRCCPCSELQLGGGGSWHPSTPVPGVERSHVFLGLKGKKEKREGVEWGGSRRWGGGCFHAPQKEQILLGGLGSIFQHAEPRVINTPSTVIA